MAISKLSVAKYIFFGCLAVGLVGWNVHLQNDLHEERSRLLRREGLDEANRQKRSADSHTQNGYPQGGALYIRWGRTVCPDDDSELVYSGIAGGAHYQETAGGAEYLCLARDAQFHPQSTTAIENTAKIYGVEIEFATAQEVLLDTSNIAPAGLHNSDVVCAVCRSKAKVTQVMIPGRRECYPGWKREYWGYLMTAHFTHKGWHSYACVDQAPEATEGGSRNDNQGLMHLVQGICGSLPCPHYVNGMEITCVVCTK
ncbi:short-chain collagen C4-like [Lineus longissimus]|uniref:short-chain collagen C4-like n=1 Tax=Lineus longissimus TaxID=88925 RepID=UPI002B4CD867